MTQEKIEKYGEIKEIEVERGAIWERVHLDNGQIQFIEKGKNAPYNVKREGSKIIVENCKYIEVFGSDAWSWKVDRRSKTIKAHGGIDRFWAELCEGSKIGNPGGFWTCMTSILDWVLQNGKVV